MDKQLEHSELDLRVLRELSSLPSFAPSPGFQDRVMARVSLPRPAPLVLLQRAGAWALQPRRAAALATAYAASVVMVVLLAGPWVSAHASFVTLGASWIIGHIGGWVNAALVAAAAWAVRTGAVDALRGVFGTGPRLWATLATVAVSYAAAGYGLHVLLRAPRRADALTRAL